MGFKDLQGCVLTDVEESHYNDVRTLIASQSDLDTCKSSMLGIYKIVDFDKSGTISRCESAQFLYGVGNTEEYALKYSAIETLPGLYNYCQQKFGVYAWKDPMMLDNHDHDHDDDDTA